MERRKGIGCEGNNWASRRLHRRGQVRQPSLASVHLSRYLALSGTQVEGTKHSQVSVQALNAECLSVSLLSVFPLLQPCVRVELAEPVQDLLAYPRNNLLNAHGWSVAS